MGGGGCGRLLGTLRYVGAWAFTWSIKLFQDHN